MWAKEWLMFSFRSHCRGVTEAGLINTFEMNISFRDLPWRFIGLYYIHIHHIYVLLILLKYLSKINTQMFFLKCWWRPNKRKKESLFRCLGFCNIFAVVKHLNAILCIPACYSIIANIFSKSWPFTQWGSLHKLVVFLARWYLCPIFSLP